MRNDSPAPKRTARTASAHVAASALTRMASRLERSREELRDVLIGLVSGLNAVIYAKNAYLSGHSERVARMAVRLGQEMALPPSILRDLYLAGLLHDIGKIGVPDGLLQRPGRLSDDEIVLMQAHPVIGERIIAPIKPLGHLRAAVRHHHERYDGAGYPDRLAGAGIPLLARVLAVADSCDAMISERPYRDPFPPMQTEAVLRDGAGSQWDPQVVEHFLRCRQDLYAIHARGFGDSMVQAVVALVDRSPQDTTEC